MYLHSNLCQFISIVCCSPPRCLNFPKSAQQGTTSKIKTNTDVVLRYQTGLLNKPHENKVTLREHPSLKCCQPLELLTYWAYQVLNRLIAKGHCFISNVWLAVTFTHWIFMKWHEYAYTLVAGTVTTPLWIATKLSIVKSALGMNG